MTLEENVKWNEPELAEAIKQFERLLKNTPDKPEHVITFTGFLRTLLRVKTKNVTVPAAEMTAILKNEKPQIFRVLKKQSESTPYLNYLININMDYYVAQKKLSLVKKLISY
ncbi:hypothetical protein [Halalkalibacterium ligniniphilum]|uniref:hypothetical protein n=1 Tax=Halalkalibacterium ligniniphilum TaxID=1134413 RepID=UPI000349DA91|nr:hypothetical protein [Halalkalibacterium ligniniphilum]